MICILKKCNFPGRNEVYTSKWFAYEHFHFLADKFTPRETKDSMSTDTPTADTMSTSGSLPSTAATDISVSICYLLLFRVSYQNGNKRNPYGAALSGRLSFCLSQQHISVSSNAIDLKFGTILNIAYPTLLQMQKCLLYFYFQIKKKNQINT